MSDASSPRMRIVPPRASVLIESMRDIGYALETALADIVDNSITARADEIQLFADTSAEKPAIGILDNGCGMTEDELLEAMRPGSRSPLEERATSDLGRFGLGLKTASFSQCRQLTVLTRKKGAASCAKWDLDLVVEKDEWIVEFPVPENSVRWHKKLMTDGTLIVWERLDRLAPGGNENDRNNFTRQIDDAATHLELVFHRFLTGEPGLTKIRIALNGRPLLPFDPFHSMHLATTPGPKDIVQVGGQDVRIQPFTLPHHKKVSPDDWSRYAGPEGYIKNQGFYVYREKRLIIHGTWFGLAKQTELTKLARARIDIPNGMDADWKIDVKKASAQPPSPVRARLRKIIDKIGATSKRTYTKRGQRLTSDNKLPIWERNRNKNEIIYKVNLDHPLFRDFNASLNETQKKDFCRILNMISATLPIDALVADLGSSAEDITNSEIKEEDFLESVKKTCVNLQSENYPMHEIKLMMSVAEPFQSRWESAESVIQKLELVVPDE